METQINLLQQQKSVQKKKSVFFKSCLVLLILVVLVTIGEIAYTYYLKQRIYQLGEAQSSTLSQIATLNSKRVKFQTLKERLTFIGTILPESTKYNRRIDVLYQHTPPGITIADIDATIKAITVTVISSNLALINTFLNEGVKAIVAEKSIGVLKAEVDAVGRYDSDSLYSASVKFTFSN